ncbi:MAG: sigma-54-dependent Fis family transcriptional regulator [Bdellovibrionales bacterium]|nr:sigma-54-dependent Fis family transcriptional regulator [Bdellovibrionales bacterium]
MDRILLIEDAKNLRDVLSTVLENEGYAVDAFETAEKGIQALGTNSYSLVLSDFKLPGMNGLDLLKGTRESHPIVPFLIMTAFGSIEVAVEAMKLGANDFISKPFEPKDLCAMVREVIDHKQLLDRRTGRTTKRKRDFLTKDPTVLELLNQARKVARFDTSVLIVGESGTGKELLARYVHEHSARADKTFISINCAAMPAELLESEFFGHEAGSFTGATQSRAGLFEVAKDGTIFLDEIGDMPAELQVKLLRALQEKEIKRVGSNSSIAVNPRILPATNCNIEEALETGKLREDLYYRLAVMTLETPPLRRRTHDLDILLDYFVGNFSQKFDRKGLTISKDAREICHQYRWPGNIRELENVIERAVILADRNIEPEHLGIQVSIDFDALDSIATTLPEVVSIATRKAEVETILKALECARGNKTKAAAALGVSYKTLLNKIKEYQLNER